jgi:phosphoribosylformylglycinamidine synthase
MKVNVEVKPRAQLADPQSDTVTQTLRQLGFAQLKGCRIGRWIELEVESSSKGEAEKLVKQMCERLLINPILEDAEIHVVE